jgi:hypothetical protein
LTTNEPVIKHRKVVAGSERSLGVTFAVVLTIVAVSPVLHRNPIRWWALGVALLFLALAFIAPAVLKPLNWIWFRIGLALHAVVNPALMMVIFSCAVVPIGALLKMFRKDSLRLKRDPNLPTYWMTRSPPGPTRESMLKQF